MTPNRTKFLGTLLGLLVAQSASAGKTRVYFITPKNNDTVGTEVTVRFGIQGMEVKPAGDMTPRTGHHHVLVDGGPILKGQVVPKSETALHFGKGETEARLRLAPGKHTLTMQFADGAHLSYGEAMSSTITVNVK